MHKEHKAFNNAFSEFYEVTTDDKQTSGLTLISMIMKDYCNLERVLVLINTILFSISLGVEHADKEVNAAILYIMFGIAYFVSSTSCLSGASNLKRKACFA